MALVTTVYAVLRNGLANAGSTVQKKNGSWTTDLTMAVAHMPHAIHQAPDGTLWMIDAYQGSADRIWRKLVGGVWTEIATHAFLTITNVQAVSADEVWVCGGRYVTRWTTAGGWTNWDVRTIIGTIDFEDVLIHYISPTNVIATGWDGGGGTTRVAKWDGATWSLISSFSAAFYATAIHSNGNDLWLGKARFMDLYHHPALGVGAGWTTISNAGFPTDISVAVNKTITGIYGSITDLWVSIETVDNEVDVLHTTNNGASWTGYIRNSAYGCVGLTGDGFGKIYAGHIGVQTISVWDGAAWSTEEPGGVGTFRGWVKPSPWERGYQKLLIVAATVTSKIQQEQIYGGLTAEQVFTASAPDGNGRQQFVLGRAVATNTDMPSGYLVRVFVNGLEHQYNTPAGVREFDVINDSTVEVGGLNLNDDIEIVYGGS